MERRTNVHSGRGGEQFVEKFQIKSPDLQTFFFLPQYKQLSGRDALGGASYLQGSYHSGETPFRTVIMVGF